MTAAGVIKASCPHRRAGVTAEAAGPRHQWVRDLDELRGDHSSLPGTRTSTNRSSFSVTSGWISSGVIVAASK